MSGKKSKLPANFMDSDDSLMETLVGTDPNAIQSKIEPIAITKLIRSSALQPRVKLDSETIADYASKMHREKGRTGFVINPMSGERWKNIIVYTDGEKYWLADGFHRVAAAEKRGHQLFQAEIRQGVKRDAFIYSLGANEDHGLKRNSRDKRTLIQKAVSDPELRNLSSRDLQDILKISHTHINNVRNEMINDGAIPALTEVKGTDGKLYPVNATPDEPAKPTPPMKRKAGSSALPTKKTHIPQYTTNAAVDAPVVKTDVVETGNEESEPEIVDETPMAETWREELGTMADRLITMSQAMEETDWKAECAIVSPTHPDDWAKMVDRVDRLQGQRILVIPLPPGSIIVRFMQVVARAQRLSGFCKAIEHCIVGDTTWMVLSNDTIEVSKKVEDIDNLLTEIGISGRPTIEIKG